MRKNSTSIHVRLAFLFLFLMIISITSSTVVWVNDQNNVHAGPPPADQFTYLPLISYNLVAPPPRILSTVSLGTARCSNTAGVNETTGMVYITNSNSNSVSILKNDLFLKEVPTGIHPTSIASVTGTPRVFITNQQAQVNNNQISVFDGETLTQKLPEIHEPYWNVYNPVNNYVYATDLEGLVRVYDATTLVTIGDIDLPGNGWPLTATVDPQTGYVYVATWEYRDIYVIDGLTIIDTIKGGWGMRNIVLDENSGYFYIAHSDPNGTYKANISVFQRDDYTVTMFETAQKSWDIDVDPLSGLAYATNPEDNTITLLKGRTIIDTIPANGLFPRAVEVNRSTGYAYVTNEQSNTVTIMKDGVKLRTDLVGNNPWEVAINNENNRAYIINRNYYLADEGNQICQASPTVTIYGQE